MWGSSSMHTLCLSGPTKLITTSPSPLSSSDTTTTSSSSSSDISDHWFFVIFMSCRYHRYYIIFIVFIQHYLSVIFIILSRNICHFFWIYIFYNWSHIPLSFYSALHSANLSLVELKFKLENSMSDWSGPVLCMLEARRGIRLRPQIRGSKKSH